MEVKSKWAAAVFIVMALVLALGMAVVAAPAGDKEAEAYTQQWGSLLTPNPTTLGFMPTTDVNLIALSPNFDTDNTIYTITWDAAAGSALRKSTDGGYWWETLGGGLPAWPVDMAVAPDDPGYVVVTDATTVFASTDGGAVFSPMGAVPLVGGEAITSVAVSPLVSGIHQIMVGVSEVAGVLPTEGVYIWGTGTPPSLTWTRQGVGAEPIQLVVVGAPTTVVNNVTINYLDQAGAASVTPAVAVAAGLAIGAVIPVTLAAGDTGVLDVIPPVTNTAIDAGVSVDIVGVNSTTLAGNLTFAAIPGVYTDGSVLSTDVTSVAFSPNFYSDGVILAVGSELAAATGDTYLHIRDVTKAVGTWNDAATFGVGYPAAGVAIETTVATDDSPSEAAIVASSIALPGDYDGTRATKRIAFVAYDSGTVNGDDAWRVSNTTPWRLNVAGGAPVSIASLDFAGDIAGGALLAGLVVADVYVCTAPSAGVVMWTSASKAPTGPGNTQVAAPADFPTSGKAYAATGGVGVPGFDESALSKTEDFGDTWNQTGLIDTSMDGGITDVAPIDATNAFMTTMSATSGMASLWKSVPGGPIALSLWERVDCQAMANVPDVELSPDYATDNTVYWADTALGAGGGTGLIRVSQDGGAYFATRNAPLPGPPITGISDFVVEDANTIYVVNAATATVFKSSDTGRTWPTTGVLAVAGNIIEREPVTGALGVSGTGIISVCTDTTTHPLSFSPIAIVSAPGALQYIAFSNEYDSDAIMYVADSGGGVFKVVPLVIEQIDLTAALANTVVAPSGIACTADGTLYVSGLGALVDNDVDGFFNEDPINTVDDDGDGLVDEDPAENGAVFRTMNPSETPVIPGVEPQWVALSWGLAAGAQPGGVPGVAPPATAVTGLATISGSNVLFSVDVGNDMVGPPAAPLLVKHTLVSFSDTLVTTVPTLVSPANGAITGVVEAIPVGTPRVRVDFEWSAVPDAHVYELWIDTDAGFHNPTIALITAPDTTVTNAGVLLTDMEYYWRVRVNQFITTAGTSPWSAAWSFTTPVGTAAIAPEILGPEHGQQNVGVEDPCFTWGSVTGATEYKFTLKDSAGTVLVDTTATETSYCYAGELEYETSYVWTVQGVSATTESGVASATFSTEAEAEPTPAWVWIIIAIGAVVAIVVIVLIVRTRRPV